MGVSDAVVSDNQIENVFSNMTAVDTAMLNNGAGVQNIIIENNQFDSLNVGVLVNAQGLGDPAITDSQEEAVVGLQVAHNRFSGSVDQAISLQSHILDDAVTGKFQTGHFAEVDVYGNVFEQVDSALIADLDDDEYQSASVCVFNNTVYESGSAAIGAEAAILDIAGLSQMQIFNNVIVNPQGDVLLTRAPSTAARSNSLEYSDNNLFLNSDILNWHLDVGGADDTAYADLVSWQGANTHPDWTDPLANPDTASLLADPQFIDQPGGDYRLSATSPASLAGRFGMSIGADYDLPASAATIVNDCIQRVR